MCIITNKTDDKVVYVSLIPGLEEINSKVYNVYFPYIGELPNQGEVFIPTLSEGVWIK